MGFLAGLVLGYHLASRLAYVLGVGIALSEQKRNRYFTRREGLEGGFCRFRRFASVLMTNDGLSFVLVCLLARGGLKTGPNPWVLVAAGVVLCILGLGTKLWAAHRLGSGAYYWRDFFAPGDGALPDPPGPYRFLQNPMYTVGYLQTYGVALILGSLPGLVAALFDQVAILLFHYWIERPHFQQLIRTIPNADVEEQRLAS